MGRSHRASKEGLQKLKQAFKVKGWTQDYLARSAGCTRQTVGKFLAGRPVEIGITEEIKYQFKIQKQEIQTIPVTSDQ